MGNLNWENAAQGIGGVLNSMAKFEQQKADVMMKIYQERSKGKTDWFNKKRELDYRQEISQKDPVKQGYLDVTQSREARSVESAQILKQQEDNERNILMMDLANTDKKNIYDWLKDINEDERALIDINSDDFVASATERWGAEYAETGKELNMNIGDVVKMKITEAFQKLSGEDQDTSYIYDQDVDMVQADFFVKQLQAKPENLQEFLQGAQANGLNVDTIRYIMKTLKGKKK